MSEFVHLHNHSDYSLLDGAASIASLVGQALRHDMKYLALTDHGNMFGAINFYSACKESGIIPIIGCEFYVAPGSRHEKSGSEHKGKYNHFIALAKNETGYRNLLRLSSLGYTEGFYYKPRIDNESIESYCDGIIATSACINGEIPVKVLNGNMEQASAKALYYESLFGKGNFFLEVQDHGIPDQKIVNKGLIDISNKTGIPLVATNDVHYTNQDDATAQDILICIGTNKKVNETDRMKFTGSEYYLKSSEEMGRVFAEVPEAITNTLRIAERCELEIPAPGPMLPDFRPPERFADADEYLRELTFDGLKKRYGPVTQELKERIEYELGIITSMGFTGYYLIVWDIVRFALENEIPVGPGRGSGPGSLVAYALHITDIDPMKYGLLFERFLNPERISMPDFDVDFCPERRQEVINYITEKYGEDKVGQIITFGTLKARAVIRDVARVLDVPYSEADGIAKLVPTALGTDLESALKTEPKLRELEQQGGIFKQLLETGKKLEGLSRHASTHAAGIVIGKTRLTDYVPLYRDPKTGAVSTQYTWELLEDRGLVKIDVLSLDALTEVQNTVKLIHKKEPDFDIEKIPDYDEATFRMLGEGKSTCVFQFESSGMQNVLKRAKPTRIEDLIALNALYRPGPMENIDQFIDSKNGKISINYPLPQLEPVLKETYGVIVYQEQVMEIARVVAGYTLGQADILRKAMGKKKLDVMEQEKKRFIEGAKERGFTEKQADEIFELLIPFAGYGFNKSHSASYALVAYKTAYLKANYPAEFMAAELTNEINAPEKMAQYITESNQMGLVVRPPDINFSEKLFTVVEGDIFYGLLGIKNVGSAAVDEIIKAREEKGAYTSLVDFLEKVDLKTVNRRVIETLIKAGLFDSMGLNRATLMHNLDMIVEFVSRKKEYLQVGQSSLFEGGSVPEIDNLRIEEVDEWSPVELLQLEKENMGFYFSGHPLDSYKEKWEKAVDIDLEQAQRASTDKTYHLIGIVKQVREIQTKRGTRMGFVQLEDYRGSIELVVFSDQWEKYRNLLTVDTVVGVEGKIDLSRGEPKVKTERVLLPNELPDVAPSAVHIRISPTVRTEEDLFGLRSFLIDRQGKCSVFLHTHAQDYESDVVIKAGAQISVSGMNHILDEMRNHPQIEAVWQE